MDLEIDQKTTVDHLSTIDQPNIDQKTLDQTLSIIYNNWYYPVSYWQYLVEEKHIPLSIQYHLGLFQEVNYQKAFELYEVDIKLGNTYAMNNLANMYREGEYVAINYQKAFELYESASKLGNKYAMSNLANMYYRGHHIDINYQKAFELYEASNKLGNSYAINKLKKLYNTHANDLDFEQIIKYMKLMESDTSITNVAIPKKFLNRISQVHELENNNNTLQQTIEELEHSPLPGSKFLEAQRRFAEMSNELGMDDKLSNDTVGLDTDTTTELDTNMDTKSGIDTV